MSANGNHASYKGKDYVRSNLNYGSTRRDFASEKSLEPQNTNFSSHPTRNFPLTSMNQKDLVRDSFEKNSPSNEPLQVKDLQNQQQKHYQKYKEDEEEEMMMPSQPIINDKTLLALDYLQKYLLPNQAVQSINLPAKGPKDQESLYLNDSESFISKNMNGDLDYQNPKIIEVESNKRTKDSSYLTESEKYERSRSRSNEKKGPYDRMPRKDHKQPDSDERYRGNRSSYNKSFQNNLEENILEQSRKAAETLDQDWECGNCGNVNWVKQRNCKKCGQNQSLNKNSSSPDVGEFHSYNKGGESLIKRNDYRHNKNFNSSGK